ncbi:MAG TPA: asparagine synthetase B, partial [Balneolaceae bacterium]|nr:asparagine synthetase B [Balneolaceae bacterium]
MLAAQQYVLIPMDASQTNHLKAYGVIFNHLVDGETGQWLLNYRGGSFLATVENDIVRKSRFRNVTIETMSASDANQIIQQVESNSSNTAVVNLEKAPKIAVYTPDQALPWDDAVT